MKAIDEELNQLQNQLSKFGLNTEEQTKYFENFNLKIQLKENERLKIQNTIEERNAKRIAVLFYNILESRKF